MPYLRAIFVLLILVTAPSAQIIGPPTGDLCTQVNCFVPHPGYVTGHMWYTVNIYPGEVSGSGGTPTANNVLCNFAPIATTVTIEALGANVQNAATGGFVGFAIYNNSPLTHRPSTLVDYTVAASTTSTGPVSGVMHNGTDTLAAGAYWFCLSYDNSFAFVTAKQFNSFSATWSIGSISQGHTQGVLSDVQAVRCGISGTTCGTTGSGWAVWAAGVPTWGVGTSATWTEWDNNGHIIEMEVN